MTTQSSIESDHERKYLLQYARASAARILGTPFEQLSETPNITGTFGGVFVTFWLGKTLRGCVGTFEITQDIVTTIEEVTQGSLQDPRFAANPVTAQELQKLTIEISILSDTTLLSDPLTLVLGYHGIIIRKGPKSGCFLPHVATQKEWSIEEFLSNCCSMKAELPPDSWQDPDTEVLVFSAEVFSDSDHP